MKKYNTMTKKPLTLPHVLCYIGCVGRPRGRQFFVIGALMDEISYKIIRSNRKTAAIQIRDGQVLVRCPYGTGDAWVRAFVNAKSAWIEKHLPRRPAAQKFTQQELSALRSAAKRVLPHAVADMAQRLGVRYGRVCIRAQKTRWGSCTAKGDLNLNCLLMLVPEPVRDYVIVHELCHRKQMDHSAAFWKLVQAQIPDYREKRAWLKNQGAALIERL